LITSSELFDLAEYVKINTNHDYKTHRMNGWSSFKSYLNALTYLLDHQKYTGHNSLPYGSLRKNGDMKKLMDLVKTRHITVAKRNFDNSIKNASMRFQIVEKIPQIKEGFWNRNGHATQWHVASLRDRYFFLFTKGGLVCGESPIRAELSDMFSIVKKMKNHPVMMPILLLCKSWKEKPMQARLCGGALCAINM
jgi:hypothetical protein